LRQILPGRLIPKEGGHVDQDGVEELGELFRVDLQVVLVLGKTRRLHGRDAPLEAAHETEPLVAAEVKAATLLEVAGLSMGAATHSPLGAVTK